IPGRRPFGSLERKPVGKVSCQSRPRRFAVTKSRNRSIAAAFSSLHTHLAGCRTRRKIENLEPDTFRKSRGIPACFRKVTAPRLEEGTNANLLRPAKIDQIHVVASTDKTWTQSVLRFRE